MADNQPDPVTLRHLAAAFPSASCPIAAFQRALQVPITGPTVARCREKPTTDCFVPEHLLEAIEQVLPSYHGKTYNITEIYRACIRRGLLQRSQVAPNTFRRIVNRYHLLKPADATTPKARLAFAKAHANDLWQGDTLHGPYLPNGLHKPVKTFLICFIDDASRVIPRGAFYHADDTPNLIDCFQTALDKRGLPKAVYVDNGSNYASREFAHLLPVEALHKLRLMLEDFPKNHNLILIGQPALNTTLQLRHQLDIKSRVTYSAKLDLLSAATLTTHIHQQLDLVGLPHQTFTDEAVHLILRLSEGTLRTVKNLRTGSLIEAVRDQTKTVGLKQVNAVLMQPHWRHNAQDEPAQPLIHSNQKPRTK